MGIHIEWVDAALGGVSYVTEGEAEDAYGTVNEQAALVLHLDDAVIIEGTNEELARLAERMLDLVPKDRCRRQRS